MSHYRIVHFDNDGPMPDDADWWVRQEGHHLDHGPFPTREKAALFVADREAWHRKERERPASNHAKYQ